MGVADTSVLYNWYKFRALVVERTYYNKNNNEKKTDWFNGWKSKYSCLD